METGRPYTKFVRRLQSILTLSKDDVELLSQMPTTIRSYNTDQDIVREGDTPSQCCLLLDGFLCRHKIAYGSARQIMSFHVPGDIPDLHSLHLQRMDHNLTSVGSAVVAFIPHSYFHDVLPRSQQLTHALWRETLVDAAVFREWVVNVGARDAIARVAHLLCEFKLRLQAVGLVTDATFTLPARQTDIADACGITAVHANRVIQELRGRGLIEWKDKTVTILQWDELAKLGDFSADYLHLRREEPSSSQRTRGGANLMSFEAKPHCDQTAGKRT
jgi:CRP-like cAMP-binding protein